MLGLVGTFMPLLPAMAKSTITGQAELSPAVQLHLAKLEKEILSNLHRTEHRQLIKKSLKPVHILKSDTTKDGYSFTFRNHLDQTIQLISQKGKTYSRL